MKHLLLAACLGAFALTTGSAALAQEPAKKTSTAKKSATKTSSKSSSKSKTAKRGAKAGAAAAAAAAVIPQGEKWQCELGKALYVNGNMLRDEVITVHWDGRDYRLPRQTTVTGADRYFDQQSGLDMVVIPSKAMLFDRNHGQRLADECQTSDMLAGGSAPTQAGALRAPVATPLLMAPAQAAVPTPTPLEGTPTAQQNPTRQ
ncbi:hypothetical protein [Cupriavidus sp. AU9028]|uniref:hypothetical protein n=1 Tax=Cupriavidus sp. AU9028 TaxID=2871157 RepID=UPI001C9897EF|nr:hypothetical protein [Cupriavidus sp. AU9028]MBY4896399.1 hypothetical protein [Cupriavidus sp. AU9028]